jgi:DNA processing protein
MIRACRDCLSRSWLLARLSGHLEVVRAELGSLLELPEEDLIAAVSGGQRDLVERERAGLNTEALSAAVRAAGLGALCRCDPGYPVRLRALNAPPAVLYVAGGLDRFESLCQAEPVAIVGSRRASEYGTEMARSLGRDLAASGLTVVSGMARGIDAAAHLGALQTGATVAVLPGPADRPYPPSHRRIYRAITDTTGVAVSELPCGTGVRRWCFQARNRVIAGLSAMTVVVEASDRSGALPTAETAWMHGRQVGAVPGRVTSTQASGSNALLKCGAVIIRNAQDVLDCLYGVGARSASSDSRPAVTAEQRRVLDALSDGQPSASALRQAGVPIDRGLVLLSELELAGWIRRSLGGSFTVVP